MKKEDCRVGMVVWEPEWQIRAVVIKCNPKNAKVKILEDIGQNRRGNKAGSTWNMPYKLLEPWCDPKAGTFMVMKSFEQPENQGIKTYFQHNKANDPVETEPDSPEHHVMMAVCELWRRLEDESLAAESGGNTNMERRLRSKYSNMINKLFSALGREISQDAANAWETGKIGNQAV